MALVKPIPRVFAILTAVVLLALCVTVPTQLFRQARLEKAIADAAYDLDIARQRLQKQQQEYAEAIAALPLAEADALRIAPEAEAAYAKEQELRAQRKALRSENASLAQQLEALLTQVDAAKGEAASVQDALLHLMDAADALEALHQLYQ